MNKRTLLFAPTTPPRRKMAFLSRHHKASHGEAFKNQNPARGRKCFNRELFDIDINNHLRTRTPQGDGNVITRMSKMIEEFDI